MGEDLGRCVFQKAVNGRRSVATARLATWWICRTPEGTLPTVSIMCPVCEKASTLRGPWGGHSIYADGTVTPSIVCNQKKDDGTRCNFHVHGRLDGWEPVLDL